MQFIFFFIGALAIEKRNFFLGLFQVLPGKEFRSFLRHTGLFSISLVTFNRIYFTKIASCHGYFRFMEAKNSRYFLFFHF